MLRTSRLAVTTFWLLSASLARAAPLVLDPDAEVQSLSGHLEALVDETGSLDVDDVAATPWSDRFTPVDTVTFRQGFGAYGRPGWIRFTLQNASDVPLHREVALAQETLDEVAAWPDGPAGPRWLAGLSVDPADRVIGVPQNRFPVDLAPGASQTWLVRVRDEGSVTTAIDVATRRSLEADWHRSLVVNGGMAVSLAWIALLAVLVAMMDRSIATASFGLLMVGMVLAHGFFFWGYPSYLIQDSDRAWISNRLGVLSTILVWVGLTGLTTRLLRLRVSSSWAARGLWTVVAVIVSNSLFMMGVDFDATIPVNLAAIVVGLVGLLATTTRAGWGGDPVARWLTFAFAMYLGSFLLFLSQSLGGNSLLISVLLPLSTLLFVTGVVLSLQQFTRRIVREHEHALVDRARAAEQRARMVETFERFVPKEVLRVLGIEHTDTVVAGDGVSLTMTVLFCDIRGFTALTEGNTPEQAFRFVNDWVATLEPAISGHGGFIDKYIGDSIMALFPDSSTDAAIGAALEMMERQDAWNRHRALSGLDAVRIGIGLHTGPLVLGTVGGTSRVSATVIGDAVNVAARVEEMTKRFSVPIIVSEAVCAASTPGRWAFNLLDEGRMRGRKATIGLFGVRRAGGTGDPAEAAS